MNNLARVCQKSLIRHREAFLILAFLIADSVLSGWMLVAGTLAAVWYVIAPAVRTIPKLDPKGRIAYLRAFVQTPNCQKLIILLFWVYSLRAIMYAISSSMLWQTRGSQSLTSFLQELIYGAYDFVPFVCSMPILFFLGATGIVMALRTRLAPTKADPDLVQQRKKFTAWALSIFNFAFLAGVTALSVAPDGPALMISNWLLASARDANFFSTIYFASPPYSMAPALYVPALGTQISAFVPWFDTFVMSVFGLTCVAFFWQPAQKFAAFLTSFCWRVVNPFSLQNIVEASLEALRLNERSLTFAEKRPFLNNCLRSLVWVLACYAGLFWLFGFCGGPLGDCINNWMISSAAQAKISSLPGAQSDFLYRSNFRIFLASFIAMYAVAPIAVSMAIILPLTKARKITLNSDYISFFQGPFVSLMGRQTRLWSDLKELRVVQAKSSQKPIEFVMRFASGGSVKFDMKQMSAKDLAVLLAAIDQHAVNCVVEQAVIDICRDFCAECNDEAASDGGQDSAIKSIAKQDFKSTVFVPHSTGEFLPGTKIRIIKQLASKPLCAIYLAREESGKLLTVKQFYLADDTAETRAFAKILQREYELLSKLDHPSIAKVFSAYSFEKSTYLMVEHRLGTDLREVVEQNGPRSEAIITNYAKQLCKTMSFLHGQDPIILHRDLTPDNIIAGEDGQLRLIDFGAAREFLEGITGTMIGKQCYVAPEQLRGDATVQSDIYSFGCTLFYLLTGRDPKALSQSSPSAVMDCSEHINKLIQDCTSFNAEERPKSFAEIEERFQSFEADLRIKMPSKKEKVPV